MDPFQLIEDVGLKMTLIMVTVLGVALAVAAIEKKHLHAVVDCRCPRGTNTNCDKWSMEVTLAMAIATFRMRDRSSACVTAISRV